MDPLQIYQTYHGLWKIEESFRITKSYLDARPVYVQKKETIYGHFLICYLSLFLLRVLEIKVFQNKINSYDLIHFMRDFRIVSKGDGSYINISRDQMYRKNTGGEDIRSSRNPRGAGRKKIYAEDTDKTILELRNGGMTLREIAGTLQCSIGHVQDVLKRWEV